MYLEVYVDVIFIINFIMDFILLFVVNKILKINVTVFKLCLGAGIGAAGACLFAILPDLNLLLRFLLAYLLLSCLMIKVSFTRLKRYKFMKAVILLYVTTFFLGGLLNSLYYYTRLGLYMEELVQGRLFTKAGNLYFFLAITTGGLGLFAFVKLFMKHKYKELELYDMELVYNGKTARVVGFMDTGNCLRDPYFGKPVIISEYTVIEPLLTNTQNTMLQGLLDGSWQGGFSLQSKLGEETGKDLLPIRMIPFHSVGSGGMLPAFELDKIILWEGKEETVREKVMTAICREKLSVRKDYQIILHREVIN